MKRRMTLSCVGIVALALSASAGAAEWVQTWGAAPLPPSPAQPPFPATESFSNQTIRQIVRVSVGGGRVRLRLSNEYGSKPLVVGAARIALSDEKGNITAGTEKAVLFDGKPGATIPAGAPFLSDPIDLKVEGLASLSISLYFPEDTGPCTCHATGVQNGFVSDAGDFTAKAFTPAKTIQYRAFLSGIDVESAAAARSVVVLGDSISDGVGATVDANHRWPDLLANRLNAKGAKGWGVVNMGISGNRVLGDGAGQSALTRFDRDVLSATGVKTVVIFEGVNDLGIAYGKFEGPFAERFKALAGKKVAQEDLIAGYRQLIARAHARGIKVVAATITPYGGAMYFSEEGDAVRQAVNNWIRTSKEVDGVIDFDAVIRDPAKPTQIKDGFHAGDHLHGSDAGYAAMAAAIDLKLFQ